MAKRHLEQYDKNGNMLDIYLNEEEVMVGDQTLAEKLADMEDDIDDAAQTGGEGTVTGVKVGSNTYEPTDGVVDISGAVPTSTSDLNNNSDFTTKAYVDAAVQAVQTALNNLMNGQNVTDAIDTFNEIVAFLDDIDTDDPTLSNQLLALNNAITALQTALAGKISGIKTSDNTPLTPDSNGIVTLPPAGSTISPASNAPIMDGTANVGSSAKYAREDHVHPHDTTKANASDVYTKTQTDTLLSGKQDTLTFDNAPGNTDNPVKSGGIKTALDAKANAADVPTKTEMADAIDDALGEAEVTVVPANSVGIITSLGSDSDEDALSASMGKKLKVAIITILNSLGNYAFPGGKPTIDWGGSSSVTYTVTYPTDSKVTHTGAGDTVELGSSLEVTLGIASGNDLYAIKDSSVKVYMSGVEQSGAYNASTQKVTLAAVTGNVVIVAEAWTYVQNGLAFQLDGKNRGGTSGHWVDLINNIDFTLGGQTENADHVAFDGGSSSGGEAPTSASLDVDEITSTVEAVYELNNDLAAGGYYNILRNKTEGKACIGFMKGSNPYNYIYGLQSTKASLPLTCFSPALCANTSTEYMKGYLSLRTKAFISQGTLSREEGGYFNGNRTLQSNTGTTLGLADRLMLMKSAGAHTAGKVYAVRVYSRRLTDDEILQNYAIDQKRFNLS